MNIKTGRGTIALPALIAIYSISMVTSLPGLAISPILGQLETVFKGVSELQLQMLESLPSFIIVPFILLAGRLSINMSRRNLLIAGLSIFFVCSVIYPFAHSLKLLLYISALLGIGAGLVIPFSTGLVADYFTGTYRTKQLGIVSAITNLTLVLATLLSGFLAGIDWHYSFLVYCFSGISLFFSFFLDKKTPETTQPTEQSVTKFKWPVKLMSVYYLITLLALTIPLNLSLYMHNLKMGNNETSGTLISIFFLSITIPGLFINKIIRWFKGNTDFISLACISLGLILFASRVNLFLLAIGVVLIGIGYGIIQPVIYDKTVQSVSAKHATYALALVMVMNYIAIVSYPFILEGIQSLFNNHTERSPFIFMMVISVVFTIFAFLQRHKKTLG